LLRAMVHLPERTHDFNDSQGRIVAEDCG
jgi:hypothetical protein